MSAIITGVIDLTFGLLWDKLRDHTAECLQDGDVTDEKCRQIIVRELDEMKSILERLSRKDLLASISFLKEGVCLLNMAFDLATDDVHKRCGSAIHCGILNEMSDITSSSASGETSSQHNLYEHERYEEAIKPLSQIIANLGVASKDRLESARMSFADARREATRAFNNKALSTKDRILACKLRVISRMLESIQDPKAVVETCMLYVEELHNLEAIQGIFNVHINGGLKSLFKKRERQELMSSVIMISYVLANFTLSFAEEKYNLLHWPKVEISRRSFHPLIDPSASTIMHSGKCGAPNVYVFDRMHSAKVTQHQHHQTIMPEICTIGNGRVAEVKITEGVLHFCFFQSTDEITTDCPKILLVVTHDGLDNIYVVAYIKLSAEEFEFTLLVADKTGGITCESNLAFLAHAEKTYRDSAPSDLLEEFFSNSPTHVELVVNTTGEILIFGHQTFIYICDGNCVLSDYFKTADRNDIVCTIHDDIITAAYYSNTVYVYSLNGSMIRKFDVRRGTVICDVVSHHTSHMIYALTRNFQEKHSIQLEIHTQLGEHRGNLQLPAFNFLALLALREGPVAVIFDKGFILT